MIEGTCQRELEDASGIRSESHPERQERSCAGCQNHCHSIHGTVVWRCSLEGCSDCADLVRINDEMRLSNVVREREQIVTIPHHDTINHRLPVEILSLIFVFVKDAIINFKFKKHHSHLTVPKSPYRQPSQSPPLLVGAVCNQWREITMRMPWLWTDIIVDLIKNAKGQSNMVTNWAHRAGSLPLDLTIFSKRKNAKSEELSEELEEEFSEEPEEEPSEEVEDVLSALRTVSAQWNDVTLSVPASFCYRLFNNLQETPTINTLFLEDVRRSLHKVKLLHPLRPRRLITASICSKNIPFEWDRLVFVNLTNIDDGEILHVIRHAQNLRYCIAFGTDTFQDPDFPIPTSPITNRSLIHLEAACDIIGHLTLPSLLYLDYQPSEGLNEYFGSLVEFVDRSRSPLHELILRWGITSERPLPPFQRLPQITSLFLDIEDEEGTDFSKTDDFLHALTRPSVPEILPHLQHLTIHLTNSSASWSLFSRLFPRDTISPDLEAIPEHSVALRRPLSAVEVFILDDAVTISKDTFLHLVGVQSSGVRLMIIVLGNINFDFFDDIAQIYDVELY